MSRVAVHSNSPARTDLLVCGRSGARFARISQRPTRQGPVWEGSVVQRPFRFAFQPSGEHLRDPAAVARRAEELGFDVVVLADHVGTRGPAPLTTLGVMAQATTTIRLGTLVLNHDMRNPVQLAWEVASLDRLSGGRVELGLGAGHTPQEYAATGIPLDPPKVRKARLMEGVEVLRGLLDGDRVTYHGEHLRLDEAQILPAAQQRLPILVGGNGHELLTHAGANADIVGLQGLGRTLADGHAHTVKWDPAWLDTQVEQIRAGAGDRFDHVELNALVQVVDVTDQRDEKLAEVCAGVAGLEFDHASQAPYLLIGTVDEIVEQLVAARSRWGITYFAVRGLDDFAPVLDAVRATNSLL